MESDIFEQLHARFDDYLNNSLADAGIELKDSIISEEKAQQLSVAIRRLVSECTNGAERICSNSLVEASQIQFNKNHCLIWGNCFSLSRTLQHMLEDLCSIFVLPFDEQHITQVVLLKLFAKGIRTYAEINTLLQYGYPYGAISLTRNLIEVLFILRFIKKYGNEVALAYYEASEEPLTENNGYEWARGAGCFKKGKPISLKLIRDKCNSNNPIHTELYSVMCKFSHASPQAVNNEIGEQEDNLFFIGQSSYGVEMPAINSAIIIALILTEIMDSFENRVLLGRGLFCLEWVYVLGEEYKNTAERLQQTIKRQN